METRALSPWSTRAANQPCWDNGESCCDRPRRPARLGRFEEAYALANRAGVADHLHAVQFRTRLALDLIARASRRGGVDDLPGAIDDLNLAERIGAPPDSLAAARLNLADQVAEEIQADLGSRQPV